MYISTQSTEMKEGNSHYLDLDDRQGILQYLFGLI